MQRSFSSMVGMQHPLPCAQRCFEWWGGRGADSTRETKVMELLFGYQQSLNTSEEGSVLTRISSAKPDSRDGASFCAA